MRFLPKLLLSAFALGTVGCDHATKYWAETTLADGTRIDVVPGVLDLVYTQNHDVAFNLLDAVPYDLRQTLILVMSSLAVLLVIAMWARRFAAATRLEHVAYPLILAGAVGNVVDRLARGYVVDFIQLPHWPTFNVADVAIVVGVVLLTAVSFRASRDGPTPLPDS